MIHLIILLVVLGVVFYFIEMIPMAVPFLSVIRVVAVLIAVFLVLQYLGVDTGFNFSR